MTIRIANTRDVGSIVQIHESAFKDFFLTSLGTDFLELYYKAFIDSDETITLCAIEDEGKLVGFSASSILCKGFNYRLLKKNLFSFGVLSLKLLLTKPKALLRLLKNMTKKDDQNTIPDDEDYAELYSIGVDSSQQGKGIGRKLIVQTESLLKEKGVKRLSLTTDYYNNHNALAFYKSMGYYPLYDFITYPKRRMYRLIKSL